MRNRGAVVFRSGKYDTASIERVTTRHGAREDEPCFRDDEVRTVMVTGERPFEGNDEVAALKAAWCERVAADAESGRGACELFGDEDDALDAGVLDAIVTLVAARVATDRAPSESEVTEGARAALAAGRAAHERNVDLLGLQRLFGHLHGELFERLLGRSTDPEGSSCDNSAAGIARRVRTAMEQPIVEATRGWFDEAGRKLRHDLKTPLQATSLNLELLTLESAEQGLDTTALDTIQGSLDQVVAMLARAEPANG